MALLRRALISAQRAACIQQEGCLFSMQALSQAGSWQQQRAFAQPAAQEDAAEPEEVPPKIKQLATDIMALSILECSQLSNILREKLGIPKGAAAMPMMAMPAAMPAAGGAPAAADAAAPKEEKKEKTEFDVKLDSFTPEGKIKVIKEIRALTNLGLKEAKELVEKAPVVIKTGVSKADAEAMQKQLEAVGGKVVME